MSVSRPATTTTRLRTYPILQSRAMASASSKCEWLVIVPDFEGALQKRLEVRQKHLGGITPEPDFWIMGGAFMGSKPKEGETPDMKGSAMICYAESEEEVRARLEIDVYVTSGVWDMSKVQIYPFRSAVRKGL
ncbi:hypothetical protein EJ05DRAFT_299341 [Pseudovirgaria hyperparasitica]|uniref:YCII-related domain-containing protein n=1 Tax=Pseudovirgaria hyperparasitica TaxID=470096 RepID=A0A6A6W9C6_9PEZI|nr:uncharacterized protein EJ05DRAFT_299341 [Pseudovirgaria hyperparasitica]KAF2759478.1 hypothetical protein EJ05DRAFT_299341 [Pseudovirgaria hyperparasitica]